MSRPTFEVPGPRADRSRFSPSATRRMAPSLVAWVAKKVQNSNGVVGLHGNSYRGLTQMLTVAALGTGSPVMAMAASCMGAEFYPETYFASGIPTQTLNFQRVIGNSMGGDTAAAGVAIVDRASVVGCQQGARKGRLIGRMFTQLAAVSKLLAINRQPGWSILEYRSHRSRH